MTQSPESVSRAHALSVELSAQYCERDGRSIGRILTESGSDFALVVQASRLTLSDGATVYSYHPNMLLVRGLNVLRKSRDVFLDAAEFRPGESALDCTLGFGCEASLASLAVGPAGRVLGLESSPALAAVTRAGMAEFPLQTPMLREAMRRVDVLRADYTRFLEDAAGGSFDVVCFDPFFDERIEGSEHAVSPLVRYGDPRPLNETALMRARRVARRRVILKHPRFAVLPDRLLDARASVVTSRKGPTAYSLFDPLADV